MAKRAISEDSITLTPDDWLMYLIQSVTKQKTDEILGFFYDFGKEVGRIGIEQMKGSSIRKDIRDFYPGTTIPFKLLVESTYRQMRRYDFHTGQYIDINREGEDPDTDYYGLSIKVIFPESVSYVDTKKMLDVIIDKTLLGGCSLPDFEQPKPRTPRMFKDLIDSICQKQKKT